MTTLTALAQPAPTLSGLIATDSRIGMGINLTWTLPITSDLYATEIWASLSNDRNTATLITTVTSNNYFYPAARNSIWYFWIRSVNIYGRANGSWFPVNATAGISGTSVEFSASGINFLTTEYAGTGNFIFIARKILTNPNVTDKKCDLIFGCFQKYSSGPKTTEFELRNFDGTTETVLYNYGSISEKVYFPNFVLQEIFTLAGTTKTIRLYWKGEDSTVSVTRCQCASSFDVNSQ